MRPIVNKPTYVEHRGYLITIHTHITTDGNVYDWQIDCDGIYNTHQDALTDGKLLIDMALQQVDSEKQYRGKSKPKP